MNEVAHSHTSRAVDALARFASRSRDVISTSTRAIGALRIDILCERSMTTSIAERIAEPVEDEMRRQWYVCLMIPNPHWSYFARRYVALCFCN